MTTVAAMERTAIEARARRLAAALIATHEVLDRSERDGRPGADPSLRRALYERAQDLTTMTALLPRTHMLRLSAEHVARTVDEWAVQPVGTEDGRVGSLSMVIAISMLRRASEQGDRALPHAA